MEVILVFIIVFILFCSYMSRYFSMENCNLRRKKMNNCYCKCCCKCCIDPKKDFIPKKWPLCYYPETKDEMFDLLTKNVEKWNEWREKYPYEVINLSTLNFYKLDLSGADLSGADLSGANLGFVNLKRANLTYANLYRANLGFAQLERTNLSSANLWHTEFEEPDMNWHRYSLEKLQMVS